MEELTDGGRQEPEEGRTPEIPETATADSDRQSGPMAKRGMRCLPTSTSKNTAESGQTTGLGYDPFDHSVRPPAATCPFCGAVLEYTDGRTPDGRFVAWSPGPEECQCEGAVAERRRLRDEDAARWRENGERLYESQVKACLGPACLEALVGVDTLRSWKATSETQKRALAMARWYVDTFEDRACDGSGLYIHSRGNGAGKTHLALGVAHALRLKGVRRGIVKTSGEIIADIQHCFDYGGPGREDVKDVYRGARFLVIDDFGMERATEWTLDMFRDILNARHIQKRPTIVTSNYAPDELTRRIAGRNDARPVSMVVSRLLGRMTDVSLDGVPDHRLLGKAANS